MGVCYGHVGYITAPSLHVSWNARISAVQFHLRVCVARKINKHSVIYQHPNHWVVDFSLLHVSKRQNKAC